LTISEDVAYVVNNWDSVVMRIVSVRLDYLNLIDDHIKSTARTCWMLLDIKNIQWKLKEMYYSGNCHLSIIEQIDIGFLYISNNIAIVKLISRNLYKSINGNFFR